MIVRKYNDMYFDIGPVNVCVVIYRLYVFLFCHTANVDAVVHLLPHLQACDKGWTAASMFAA